AAASLRFYRALLYLVRRRLGPLAAALATAYLSSWPPPSLPLSSLPPLLFLLSPTTSPACCGQPGPMAGRDPTWPASAHRGSGGGPVRAGLSPQLRAAAHGLVTQIGSTTSSWATGDERRHLTWLLDSSVRQQRAPPLPHHRQELQMDPCRLLAEDWKENWMPTTSDPSTKSGIAHAQLKLLILYQMSISID
ncbi:unnamed protein product, partial [Urochloa humidicola]